MAWLDMHLHSCYSSDGQFLPRELMETCVRSGVHTTALADHNSTKGLREAEEQAQILGLTFIPAIELDCVYQGVNLHILGYWIDKSFEGFRTVEEDLLEQEQQASKKRVELVEALGIHIDYDEMQRGAWHGVVTGELIAEVALAHPKNDDNALLLPYRDGGERADNPYVNFYWDFCAQGKPAYVPIHYISLAEAIEMIRSAGGVPVLAHPGNNIGDDIALLHGIIEEGVEGIEAFSSYHSPEQTAFFLDQASKLHIPITCGSDFHGKTKPSIKVGSVDCGGLEEEMLVELRKKIKKY